MSQDVFPMRHLFCEMHMTMQKGQVIHAADGLTSFFKKKKKEKSPLLTHTVCNVLVLSNIIEQKLLHAFSHLFIFRLCSN